ncbi:EpsG family protein [Lacticaseibacillus paracasei]|uniref:EpsG family protein n=1 Tax=Lacticaseibacillus paracasei TaxID=1597 RepID=UPI0018A0F467|nr:EpsG family protein [Lacticaseibacillus paracasei]
MPYLILIIMVIYLVSLLPDRKIVLSSGKNIKLSISSMVLVVFFMLIMGGNDFNPDTPVYNTIYNMGLNYTKNLGFAHIIVFFKAQGWSYNAIRLFLVVSGLLLISITIHRYVPAQYRSFTYILYFVFPFFIDAIQLRNFLIMCILVFTLPLLFNDRKIDKVIYVVLILLAGTIQQLADIYIPLVILYYAINNNKLKKIMKSLVGLTTIIVLIVGLIPSLTLNLSSFVNNLLGDKVDDLSHYLVISTRWGGSVYWVVIFLNIFILKLCLTYSTEIEGKYSDVKAILKYKLSDLARFILWMNLMYLFVLPLINVNVDFYRVYRNFLIFNYIVYTNVIFTYGKVVRRRDKPVTITALVFVSLFFTFTWQFLLSGQLDVVIKSVMNYNWLI